MGVKFCLCCKKETNFVGDAKGYGFCIICGNISIINNINEDTEDMCRAYGTDYLITDEECIVCDAADDCKSLTKERFLIRTKQVKRIGIGGISFIAVPVIEIDRNKKCLKCGPTSKNKQKYFNNLIEVFLLSHKKRLDIKNFRNLANPTFYYVDLNSGPGYYFRENGEIIEGSPIKFIRKAIELGIPFEALFFEHESFNCEVLSINLKKFKLNENQKYHIINEDHSKNLVDYIKAFPSTKPLFGMVYSDESGNQPPFDLLGSVASQMNSKNIDIIVYLAATNIKRFLKNRVCKNHFEDLITLLDKIDKKKLFICPPLKKENGRVDGFHWTFAVNTNSPFYKELWSQLTTHNFIDINTSEGHELLKFFTYTPEDRLEYEFDGDDLLLRLLNYKSQTHEEFVKEWDELDKSFEKEYPMGCSFPDANITYKKRNLGYDYRVVCNQRRTNENI